MIFNVHAGHNPDGKTACGAVGFLKESTEARSVKDKVIGLLKAQGHTVYDCTVDNGTSQNDVLAKIVSKCNTHTADCDISIHFNAGANQTANGTTTGTEAYIYSSSSKAKDTAQRIVNEISALGFRNRGVKTSASLYFLKKTKNSALLIECCFVDDPDDAALYHADTMAQAIVKGITGTATAGSAPKPAEPAPVPTPPPAPTPAPTPAAPAYSKTDFIKEVQSITGAKVDGIAGPETLSKTITVSKTKNNRHLIVWPIQKYLNSIGFDCGTVDGIAGVKFDSAVKAYQKAKGCVVDGEITKGQKTWRCLLGL